MAIIRRDHHGFYANVNGKKARPLPQHAHHAAGYRHLQELKGKSFVWDGVTRYIVGQNVPARQYPQSLHVRIGDEMWWACENTDEMQRVIDRQRLNRA